MTSSNFSAGNNIIILEKEKRSPAAEKFVSTMQNEGRFATLFFLFSNKPFINELNFTPWFYWICMYVLYLLFNVHCTWIIFLTCLRADKIYSWMKRSCSTMFVLFSTWSSLLNRIQTLDTGLLGSAIILNLIIIPEPTSWDSTSKQALKWKQVYWDSGSMKQPACPGSTAWSRASSTLVVILMIGLDRRRYTELEL